MLHQYLAILQCRALGYELFLWAYDNPLVNVTMVKVTYLEYSMVVAFISAPHMCMGRVYHNVGIYITVMVLFS